MRRDMWMWWFWRVCGKREECGVRVCEWREMVRFEHMFLIVWLCSLSLACFACMRPLDFSVLRISSRWVASTPSRCLVVVKIIDVLSPSQIGFAPLCGNGIMMRMLCVAWLELGGRAEWAEAFSLCFTCVVAVVCFGVCCAVRRVVTFHACGVPIMRFMIPIFRVVSLSVFFRCPIANSPSLQSTYMMPAQKFSKFSRQSTFEKYQKERRNMSPPRLSLYLLVPPASAYY